MSGGEDETLDALRRFGRRPPASEAEKEEERRAWERFVGARWPLVNAVVRSRLRRFPDAGEFDAEDLSQEVFLRFAGQVRDGDLAPLMDADHARSALVRIALRVVNTELHRVLRRRGLFHRFLEGRRPNPGASPSPADEAAYREGVQKVLGRLRPVELAILRLWLAGPDTTAAGVAARLGLSERTVTRSLAKVRMLIRTFLRGDGREKKSGG